MKGERSPCYVHKLAERQSPASAAHATALPTTEIAEVAPFAISVCFIHKIKIYSSQSD